MNKLKSLLPLFMAFLMCIAMPLQPAWADPEPAGEFMIDGGIKGADWKYDENENTLNILKNGTYEIKMADSGSTARADRIVVHDGVSAGITLSDVEIKLGGSNESALTIRDGATVKLTLAGDNRLTASDWWPLHVGDATLIITEESEPHSLGAAGRYGIWASSDADIEINGGTVTCIGDWGGGIYIDSGGIDAHYGSLTINGGVVTGIGSLGSGIFADTIDINGGTVEAVGSHGYSGISGRDIIIDGDSTVTATGGGSSGILAEFLVIRGDWNSKGTVTARGDKAGNSGFAVNIQKGGYVYADSYWVRHAWDDPWRVFSHALRYEYRYQPYVEIVFVDPYRQ